MPRASSPAARPKSVVILGLNYAPETTGIAPYTTGLARHLAAQGHGVTVVAGHPHYPEWELHPGFEDARPATWDQGVQLIRVPHPVPNNPTGPSRIAMEIVFALRCLPHLLKSRPELVLTVSPALLTLAPALLLRRAKRYRVGVVVQDLYGAAVRETGVGGGLLARTTAAIELFLLRRADSLAVIHDVFRRRLLAAEIPSEKIEVIPNWAHVQMPSATNRSATRRALGWADDEFVALHAGNMGAKQGLEGLIDVGRLAEEKGLPVRVVLIGNGSQRLALRDYAADLKHVSFIEPLPEGQFEAALVAADCLLLHEKPGVLEMSVPSKLTTYFAAGRPVVAATHPGTGAAALMALSDAGVTVRAGDAAAILTAIECLAAHPETANQYGANGQYYAAEHLTGGRSLAMYQAWAESLGDQETGPFHSSPFTTHP